MRLRFFKRVFGGQKYLRDKLHVYRHDKDNVLNINMFRLFIYLSFVCL